MARQRYCRRLARHRNTMRVSADPVAKPAAHTRAGSRGSRRSKADAGERRTVCWREMDSNHRYRIKKQPFLAARARSRNSPSATKNRLFRAGTDGSKLPSSSGESANHRSLSGGGLLTAATRKWKFEFTSLQQRVACEPESSPLLRLGFAAVERAMSDLRRRCHYRCDRRQCAGSSARSLAPLLRDGLVILLIRADAIAGTMLSMLSMGERHDKSADGRRAPRASSRS